MKIFQVLSSYVFSFASIYIHFSPITESLFTLDVHLLRARTSIDAGADGAGILQSIRVWHNKGVCLRDTSGAGSEEQVALLLSGSLLGGVEISDDGEENIGEGVVLNDGDGAHARVDTRGRGVDEAGVEDVEGSESVGW